MGNLLKLSVSQFPNLSNKEVVSFWVQQETVFPLDDPGKELFAEVGRVKGKGVGNSRFGFFSWL